MATKSKTVFVCSECGYETPKWAGKCPGCGEWNTMVEDVRLPQKSAISAAPRPAHTFSATPLSQINAADEHRFVTGISELDRVLGGGIVKGSVILLSGDPGIGKSTILLQVCNALQRDIKILYVSGEESAIQIKLRAKRIGVEGDSVSIMTETDVQTVCEYINSARPDLVMIDSIQTMQHPDISSAPGSIVQVRESSNLLLRTGKSLDIPIFIVGHVNKGGDIAGPKVMEHIVDTVLYFEGERNQSYRILRAIKNRFGSTNEIGVFEMTDRGLEEVPNPSEILLAGRPKKVSGNCAACTIEGTRPIIAEIQALVSPTTFPAPRRTGNGVDYNRMCLLLAVLEKRLGLRFSANDVYLNVIGGLRLDEPAADLATALALISSITDKLIPDDLVAIGEVGLAGECRAVASLENRVREVERLGFSRAVVPYRNIEKRPIDCRIKLIPIKSVYELLPLLTAPER